MDFSLEKYEPRWSDAWNEFVRASRNGTFLFERGYMDYHADRFADCSWMIRKGSRLMALLPANLTPDGVLHSHQGLSYGGWILPYGHLNTEDLLSIFRTATAAWRAEGISALDYKAMPTIYHAVPSEEDLYALFRLGATPTYMGAGEAVDLRRPLNFNKLQRRHLAAASKLAFRITETDDIPRFMRLLSSCLEERFGAAPVHTAAELSLLRDRFPERIHLFVVEYEGEYQAGVCLFDTGRVARCQYIATTPRGRELNLLTPLFHNLMTGRYADRDYFDFGTSNRPEDDEINTGLLRQKSSYGATGVVYPRFRLDLNDVR